MLHPLDLLHPARIALRREIRNVVFGALCSFFIIEGLGVASGAGIMQIFTSHWPSIEEWLVIACAITPIATIIYHLVGIWLLHRLVRFAPRLILGVAFRTFAVPGLRSLLHEELDGRSH